jgi:uncharacterized membrane protein (UPF0127 family)
MAKLTVRNVTRNTILADRADIANTSATRRAGLLKRSGLEPGEGLWIVPSEGVHTFGMKFPIDVLFLSKSRKVLKIRSQMPQSRIALSIRAHSVLELPPGRAAHTLTAVGDELELDRYDDSSDGDVHGPGSG